MSLLILLVFTIISEKNIIKIYFFFVNFKLLKNRMYWGLGIGDWGLGIGDWAQSPIPNPQSPNPHPP